MADINAAIPYRWILGWGSEVPGEPVVNLLLKAVIEKDTAQMDQLFAQGASLKASDQTTLERVLFHVTDS